MTPLDYLSGVPFECCLGDANVSAFTEAASLREKCDFEVERKEMPLSKVVVPMLKVTPVIGTKESEATFEMQIKHAANLLVGK
jgi:hypothetical protein